MSEAYIIFLSEMFPLLNYGDARILHINEPAAELHGCTARQLVGKRLSELQEPEFRQVGRAQHTMRHHGIPCDKQYATVVRGLDGVDRGQLRTLRYRMADVSGREIYMVSIEGATELDHAQLPPLASHGLSQADVDRACGTYTFRDLHNLLYGKAPWPFRLQSFKTFASIVSECEWIATNLYDEPPGSGLALALEDTTSWSLKDDAATVRLKASCHACGVIWYRTAVRKLTWRCPKCFEGSGVDMELDAHAS